VRDACRVEPPGALFASRATEVIEMPGGHFPHWRRPHEVADILARIARDVANK
jgi:hypothetical protein